MKELRAFIKREGLNIKTIGRGRTKEAIERDVQNMLRESKVTRSISSTPLSSSLTRGTPRTSSLKKTSLRSMLRRTPLLGSPKRVLSPQIAVSSSDGESVADSSSEFQSCPLSLSFDDADEGDDTLSGLTVASETEEFEVGSLFDFNEKISDEDSFSDWTHERLVATLRDTKTALRVAENAYERRGETLERMKTNRIEALKKRAESATREVSEIVSSLSLDVESEEREDTVVSGRALLRVAKEKQSVELQYEHLKKRYEMLKQSNVLKHKVPATCREIAAGKPAFPDLTLPKECTVPAERLRAALEKWRLLQAWCPLNRTEGLGRCDEEKFEKWESVYMK